jgi:drug/metabolite transporter (DMT)-like permease
MHQNTPVVVAALAHLPQVGRKFTPTLVACICVVLVGVGIISVNGGAEQLPYDPM